MFFILNWKWQYSYIGWFHVKPLGKNLCVCKFDFFILNQLVIYQNARISPSFHDFLHFWSIFSPNSDFSLFEDKFWIGLLILYFKPSVWFLNHIWCVHNWIFTNTASHTQIWHYLGFLPNLSIFNIFLTIFTPHLKFFLHLSIISICNVLYSKQNFSLT